jgi:hypothetical protein
MKQNNIKIALNITYRFRRSELCPFTRQPVDHTMKYFIGAECCGSRTGATVVRPIIH